MARNATKCVIDGFGFDSLTESRRYLYLKELERCGEISDLKRQIKHELLPAYTVDGRKVRDWNYISDFEYYDELERIYVIEDVKGRPEPIDKYKRKMFEWNNRDGINRREMKFFWICEAPKYHIEDGGPMWVEYELLLKIQMQHKIEEESEMIKLVLYVLFTILEKVGVTTIDQTKKLNETLKGKETINKKCIKEYVEKVKKAL